MDLYVHVQCAPECRNPLTEWRASNARRHFIHSPVSAGSCVLRTRNESILKAIASAQIKKKIHFCFSLARNFFVSVVGRFADKAGSEVLVLLVAIIAGVVGSYLMVFHSCIFVNAKGSRMRAHPFVVRFIYARLKVTTLAASLCTVPADSRTC